MSYQSYRIAGKRLLFDFRCLRELGPGGKTFSDKEIADAIRSLGLDFFPMEPEEAVTFLAGLLRERSRYSASATQAEAPLTIRCGTAVQWIYKEIGVDIPEISIEQWEMAKPVSVPAEARVGDLVFRSGRHNYYLKDPAKGIGHVGIIVRRRSGSLVMAHATRQGYLLSAVGTDPENGFRGIGRIVSGGLKQCRTVLVPEELRERIRTANTLKWLVLRKLNAG